MGVYIPNMEKPKSCKECSFKTCFIRVNIKSYTCLINGGECEKTDCPLIEIVTCKECIHKMQALSTEKGATGCELISGTFYEDFFCKEGERRADGNKRRSV